MWRRFWQKLQTTIFGGAIIVSTAWLVSKALGLLKQRLLIQHFSIHGGAGGADPIIASFTIPDFVYGTLVLGSLLSAFMPVFIAYRNQDKEEAWRISRTVIKVLAGLFFVIGVVLLFAADPVMYGVAPKFDAATHHAAVTMTRIISFNMLIFAVGNVFAGVLQSFKHFVAVSLAPIIYYLGVIGGIIFLAPHYGGRGVAMGAVIGALLNTAVLFAAAWRVGWRFGPSAPWRHAGVRDIGRLLLPRTIGQSVTQIDQLVNIPIATSVGIGALTIFRLANDIQDAPVGLIGVSLATVAFPVFIEMLQQKRYDEFVIQFSKTVRQILFLIIPVTVLFLQLRAQFVRVLYGSGNVTWPETIAIAQTVGFFAISFFAQSLIPVLARSFYALKDTKTPVRYTMIAVVVDIIGSFVLGHYMGVVGLALSYTISNILNATLLFTALHRRIGRLDEQRIFQSVLRIIGVTFLMAVTVQGTKLALVSFGINLDYFLGVLIQALVAGLVGVLSYLAYASMFKLEEASVITVAWGNVTKMFRNGNGNGAPV